MEVTAVDLVERERRLEAEKSTAETKTAPAAAAEPITPWDPRQTPMQQLVKEKQTKEGAEIVGRCFAVQSPDAAASRIAKFNTADVVFLLPSIEAGRLAENTVATNTVRLDALLAKDSKAFPIAVLRATVIKVQATGPMVMTEVQLQSPLVGLTQRVLGGGGSDDAVLLGSGVDCSRGAPLLIASDTASETLIGAVETKESSCADKPHLCFIEQLAATSLPELEAEIKRSLLEVQVPDDKPIVTEFVRVLMPTTAGAQPTNTLQWLTCRFWKPLLKRTFEEIKIASESRPELKDIKNELIVEGKTPHVLVYRPLLLELARQAVVVRGGRGSVIVDARNGLRLSLKGTGLVGGSKQDTVAAFITLRIDYAEFARPDAIVLNTPLPAAPAETRHVYQHKTPRFGRAARLQS